ncbi:MAG: TonB-dependent receptor [Sulfurovaceae bacterium]|nr:TonB-dependent receptor [Sulfurovaceae bacterium]
MKEIIIINLIASTLFAEGIKLDDIVITATKVSQKIEDISSSVQVLSKEELKSRRYASVIEAINSLAGVGFTQDGGVGGASKIYIRGVGGGRVLVLVNGVRFQDPSSKFGADFSRLMLSNVEKIELISGAQSGVWGADASAGVINIITTQADEGFTTGLNLQYGTFNTKEIGAFASYKSKDYNAKLALTNYETDGFSAQSPYGSDVGDYEDDGYKNQTLDLSLGYNITPNDRVSAQLVNIDIESNHDGYKPNSNTENRNNRMENQTNLVNLAYSKKLSNQNISLRYNVAIFDKEELDATKGIKSHSGETNELELHDVISYKEKDFVLVGASYKKDSVDALKVDNSIYKHDVKSNALFVTNTNFVDDFVITQSLRKDAYSNYDDKITGKLGVKYKLNSDSSFGANYGTGYNAPSIIMILNPNGKANQELEAEDTDSLDVTATYKNASVTYFHNHVDNLISYNREAKQHVNISGTSAFKGVELKYATDIFK